MGYHVYGVACLQHHKVTINKHSIVSQVSQLEATLVFSGAVDAVEMAAARRLRFSAMFAGMLLAIIILPGETIANCNIYIKT